MTPGQPTKLSRVMGQWDLTALTLNSLIASAVFFLPATIIGLIGPWSPLAHIACALVTFTFVLCFAEAASRFNGAGGPYLYAYEAFGKFAGFEIGWIAYLTRLAAVAANYNLFILYLGHFFPELSTGIFRVGVIFVVLLLLTVINIRNVKYGAWAVDFIMIAKLIPLLILIGAGFFSLDGKNLALTSPLPYDDFIRSIFLLSFAYGGFEISTIPSGESTNPQRHLPRALIIAFIAAMVIYIGIQVVAIGVLPGLATVERPIAAVATKLMGAFGGNLVAFGALVSTFGYFSGSILSVPRLTFALSENRQLPAFFSQIHKTFQTPVFSIIFYASLVFLLAAFSNFITLAAISVVSRLLYYISTCGAVLFLRKRSKAPFTIPLGPTIPIAGILFALYLLTNTKLEEVYFALGGILVGTIFYFVMKKSSAQNDMS